MKTAKLPLVPLPETLRQDAESVLAEGETLPGFIQASVAQAIAQRRCKTTLDQRADAALAHYRCTGEFHPVDAVVARLQTKLDAKRRSITHGATTPPMQNPPDAG